MTEFKTDMLLQPLDADSPAGGNIEYDPVYAEIREARYNDPDYIAQGEWAVSEPRRADWRKVRRLSEHVLRYQSKDMQVTCWYIEAMTHLYGPGGMQQGLVFLAKFISMFWATCWPSLEEGLEIRYNIFIRLDKTLSNFLKVYPLLKNKDITHSNWYKALAFEHSLSISSEKRENIISIEGDQSVEAYRKTVNNYAPDVIRKQIIELSQLPTVIDEVEASYFFYSHEDVHKIFSNTRQTIGELTELLERFLPQDKLDNDTPDLSSVKLNGGDLIQDLKLPENEKPLTLMTRDKAIEQLEIIAHFFRQTEPTSPVPYLIERAVRWSKMSISEWLEELLKDKESMEKINSILKG